MLVATRTALKAISGEIFVAPCLKNLKEKDAPSERSDTDV